MTGLQELLLVGIGTGSVEHLTAAGAAALRSADAILLPYKGASKAGLVEVREALLDAVFELGPRPPVVRFQMPQRDSAEPYLAAVDQWHRAIAQAWQAALDREAPGAKRVALMVWGDPSLYDSTMRIAEHLRPAPQVRVVPGITALQALTAAHAIPLNTVAGSVLVTTGRRLRREGLPATVDSVAVLLDGDCAFTEFVHQPGIQIYWGAYLGMSEQLLVSGPLASVAEEIVRTRAAARQAHGWIMDTYVLRLPPAGGEPEGRSPNSRATTA